MKTLSKYLLLLLFFSQTFNANAQFSEEEFAGAYSVDSSWSLKFDTTRKHYHHLFSDEQSVGTLSISHLNDTVKFIVYQPLSGLFTEKLSQYHLLASCSFSNNELRTFQLNWQGYTLFLPLYPCSYSKKVNLLIRSLTLIQSGKWEN